MDISLVSQTPITAADLKGRLAALKLQRGELNFRAAKVDEYLQEATVLTPEQALQFQQKLVELSIPRLRDKQIIKIVDLMPETVEVLKALFAGENITIKAEDLKKIFDTIHS